jgi:hypothetical protein
MYTSRFSLASTFCWPDLAACVACSLVHFPRLMWKGIFVSKGGWGMGEGFRVGEVLHPEGISVYVNQRQPRWGRKHCPPRPVHTQPCGSPTAHQSQGRPLGNLQPCACPFARPSWSRWLVEVAQRRLIERHGSCFGDGDGILCRDFRTVAFYCGRGDKEREPCAAEDAEP